MWTRGELKSRAKDVLRGIYWNALGVSIVIALVSGNSWNGSRWNGGSSNRNVYSSIQDGSIFFSLMFIIIILGFMFFALAFRILVGYQLEVGGRRYFIQSAQYSDNRNCFRFAFKSQNYAGILLTMLLKGFQNFMWYLLLIIPGIVKYYEYSMVPYILADNPNIGCKRAIELSRKMTDGHKFDMFILDLSFLGWYLLGLLALIIGVVFVMPYQNATMAELYLVLRQNALDNGWCAAGEVIPNYFYNEYN